MKSEKKKPKKFKKKEKGKKRKKPTSPIGKAWDWIWHSDSILSWIVALALAFIIVKFIFFPILSFLLGTSLPLVVVESSSMEHPGSFLGNLFLTESSFDSWWQEKGDWYKEQGINKQTAETWPLKTGFDKGDIIIVSGRFNPIIGDVIIFNGNAKYPIIHRIIEVDEDTVATKGDNNSGQLSSEKSIDKEEIIGKAVFRIPKVGWLKLFFVEVWKGFSGK